jgi:hypothetical protein
MKARTTLRIGILTLVFALGVLCGSLWQRPAQAQLGDVMKQAGDAGGTVGAVANMGSTLSDMETHLSGLQKNLDALKKVKAALGG